MRKPVKDMTNYLFENSLKEYAPEEKDYNRDVSMVSICAHICSDTCLNSPNGVQS